MRPRANTLTLQLKPVSRTELVGGLIPFYDVDASDAAQFRITSGNPIPPVFTVDATTGQLSVSVELLDYEARSEYELNITVEDRGGLTAVSRVVISVEDINEAPVLEDVVCLAYEDTAIGAAICQASGSDPDSASSMNGTLVYTFVSDSTAWSRDFAIDSVSGIISVTSDAALDFESETTLSIGVCVTDRGQPPLQACGTATIKVLDANDAPTVISPTRCERDEIAYTLEDAARNQLKDQVICQLAVSDQDSLASSVLAWGLHTWEYLDLTADASCPFRVSAGGAVITSEPERVDYEQLKKCDLSVRATDGGGLSSTWQSIEVFVRDVNEAPSIETIGSFSVDENSAAGTVVSGILVVTDPDWLADGTADPSRVSIIGGSSTFSISNDNAIVVASSSLDYETRANYSLRLVATDSRGLASKPVTVQVRVRDVNERPMFANALFTFSVDENLPASTRLVPSLQASDPDGGDTIMYSITTESSTVVLNGAPSTFGVDPSSGQLYQIADGLDFETNANYRLQVKATDKSGLSTTATVVINVNDINEAPVLQSQQIRLPEDYALQSEVGNRLSLLVADPEMAYEVFSYSILAGNDMGLFRINPTSGLVTLVKPLDYETSTQHTLLVSVTDHGGLSAQAQLLVQVLDVNEAPVVNTFNFTVSENLPQGTFVGTPINASDVDYGTTIRYSIVEQTDRNNVTSSSCFAINSSSGQLEVANGCVLDFETAGKSFFRVKVEVSDGFLATRSSGIIQVSDVNEPPVFGTVADAVIEENAEVGSPVAIVKAIDPDAGDVLSYCVCGQSHTNTFAIETRDGEHAARVVVWNATMLNFEAQPSLWIDICVEDIGGLAAKMRLGIQLLNVYEPPFFTRSGTTVQVYENVSTNSPVGSPLGVFVWDEENYKSPSQVCDDSVELLVLDSSCLKSIEWAVDSCGQLSIFSGQFNYEAQSVCLITLVIGGSYSDYESSSQRLEVQVVVLDVNEAPVFSTSVFAFSVSEAATASTLVGYLSALDPDANSSLSYRWNASTTAISQVFTLSTVGAMTLAKGSVLDYETQPSYNGTVIVSDQWGLVDVASVTISVTDANEAPVFKSTKYTFSIVENSPSQTQVGPVTAIDSDTYQNNTLIYGIVGGNSLETFSMSSVGGDGMLLVNYAAALDYERQVVYDLVVSATDNGPGGLCAFTSVRINVTNVNEAPLAVDTLLYIAEDALTSSQLSTSPALTQAFIASLIATDPDAGDSLTFGISDSTGTFTIDAATGVISTLKTLDFETVSFYSLVFKATDRGRLAATSTVTVIVLDRNDAPVITTSEFSVAENVANGSSIGVVSITDQDAGQEHQYSLVATTLTLRDNTTTSRLQNDVVSVKARTGELTVVDPSVFDFEQVRYVTVRIVVEDNGIPAKRTEKDVLIYLVDANELCIFDSDELSFWVDENVVGSIGYVVVNDPDVYDSGEQRLWSQLRFAIVENSASADHNVLAINATTGELTVISPVEHDRQRRRWK